MCGMVEEFLRLSIRYGYDDIHEEWRQGEPGPSCRSSYCTHFSPQIFALALTDLLVKEKVDFFYDCLATWPVMEGKHCRGVILESKSGQEFYRAKMVIDTTGDADLLFRAGVPTAAGKNYFTYSGFAISLDYGAG